MSTYLVISALGDDRRGIVKSLSQAILDSGCNIEDSRMSVLGGAFAVILLVSGNWNTLAKFEAQLPELERELQLSINSRRTDRRSPGDALLPYTVDVVSLDNPGIVNQLAGFFATRGINIQDMSTSAYRAAHTATPMFAVHMQVEIPAQQPLSGVREEFLDLCDQLNLDGVIEPSKP